MSSGDNKDEMEVDPPVISVSHEEQHPHAISGSSGTDDGLKDTDSGSKGADNSLKPPKSPNKPQKSPKSSVSSPGSSDQSSEFETVSHEDSVSGCTFEQLIEKIRDSQYNVNVNTEELILVKCKLLLKKDYEIKIVKNELTENYPKELLIPVARLNAPENEKPMNFDPELYSELAYSSRVARLRSRVVVPVILFDNKFVCRSGTLTLWLSALYEATLKSVPSWEGLFESLGAVGLISTALWKMAEMACQTLQLVASQGMMDDLLKTDLKVMEHLNIERICDLMVEYNKHYQEKINLSSTEKVHEKVYKDMKMEELPFPGCEFFVSYKAKGRTPEGLFFDWKQTDVTRRLELTDDRRLFFFPELNPQEWKAWDLATLTGNYLKIMLSYLLTSPGGMDVHCISGWDRTPLFVSLLRLSLWADGLVHESLNAEEMAYFSVAYDWFLFGHNLPDRLKKGEEVMHFAFNFLENIASDEFSMTRMFKELPEDEKRGRNFPEFVSGGRNVLLRVRACFLNAYNELIISRPRQESTAPEQIIKSKSVFRMLE